MDFKMVFRYQLSGGIFIIWFLAFYFSAHSESFSDIFSSAVSLETTQLITAFIAGIPIGAIIHQLSISIKNQILGRLFNLPYFIDSMVDDARLTDNIAAKYTNIYDSSIIDSKITSTHKKMSALNTFYYLRFDNGFLAPVLAYIAFYLVIAQENGVLPLALFQTFVVICGVFVLIFTLGKIKAGIKAGIGAWIGLLIGASINNWQKLAFFISITTILVLVVAFYNHKISITYNTDEGNKKRTLAIASMWQDILGVKVNIINQEWKTFLQTRHKGDYQVARDGSNADYNSVEAYAQMYICHSPQNNSQYCNPTYDSLIKQAENEQDKNKSSNLYHKALTIALNDYPIIPLYEPTYTRLVKPYVHGYSPESNNLDRFQSKWLSLGK